MKMTKAAAIISACMLTLGLSACSSNYVMHTNNRPAHRYRRETANR